MVLLKFIDFLLNLDEYIGIVIANYGILVYFLLFAIIFLETGLVIAPFLPGDSLLFVAGAFAAKGVINVYVLFIILTIAAIAGDSFNYWIGSYFGKNIFAKSRFFKKEYLQKTEHFYDKYGAKTIVLARFVPMVRTFAPFVAGIGKMSYAKFLSYNIIGGILWVLIFLFAGYFFGGIPFVHDNLTIAVLVVVFISIIPAIIEVIRQRRKNKRLSNLK